MKFEDTGVQHNENDTITPLEIMKGFIVKAFKLTVNSEITPLNILSSSLSGIQTSISQAMYTSVSVICQVPNDGQKGHLVTRQHSAHCRYQSCLTP